MNKKRISRRNRREKRHFFKHASPKNTYSPQNVTEVTASPSGAAEEALIYILKDLKVFAYSASVIVILTIVLYFASRFFNLPLFS